MMYAEHPHHPRLLPRLLPLTPRLISDFFYEDGEFAYLHAEQQVSKLITTLLEKNEKKTN